jgi:hypothetical protein
VSLLKGQDKQKGRIDDPAFFVGEQSKFPSRQAPRRAGRADALFVDCI